MSNNPMRRFAAFLLRLILAALPLLCAGAFAAMPAMPAPIQKPAPSAIEPIAVAEILERADVDERFIREIVNEARQSDPAETLVAPLDALAADIRKLSGTFNRDELQSLPAIELESLERSWGFYDNQVAAWRGPAASHYRSLLRGGRRARRAKGCMGGDAHGSRVQQLARSFDGQDERDPWRDRARRGGTVGSTG